MVSEPYNLIALRQEFHQFPELGFNEHRTKARISGILKDLGLKVYEGIGIVGILRAGKGNRAIALRADMDALPIQEVSDHDYPSQNAGVMHACGHDGHMTSCWARRKHWQMIPILTARWFLFSSQTKSMG